MPINGEAATSELKTAISERRWGQAERLLRAQIGAGFSSPEAGYLVTLALMAAKDASEDPAYVAAGSDHNEQEVWRDIAAGYVANAAHTCGRIAAARNDRPDARGLTPLIVAGDALRAFSSALAAGRVDFPDVRARGGRWDEVEAGWRNAFSTCGVPLSGEAAAPLVRVFQAFAAYQA
jgi:hypothetical protein